MENNEIDEQKARLVQELKNVPEDIADKFMEMALQDVIKFFEKEPSKTEAAYRFYRAYLMGYIHARNSNQ